MKSAQDDKDESIEILQEIRELMEQMTPYDRYCFLWYVRWRWLCYKVSQLPILYLCWMWRIGHE